MTIEHRMDQLQKRNKCLTVALTMTATGDKRGVFDTVVARHIAVTNSAGEALVTLGADFIGNGTIYTFSAKGKTLVFPSSTDHNEGLIETRQGGKKLVALSATQGEGYVRTYKANGRGQTLQP